MEIVDKLIEDLGGLEYLALMCNAREFDIRQWGINTPSGKAPSVGAIRFKVGWNNSTHSVLIVCYEERWIWRYGLAVDAPESTTLPWGYLERFNTLSDLDYNFHSLTGLHLTNHFIPTG